MSDNSEDRRQPSEQDDNQAGLLSLVERRSELRNLRRRIYLTYRYHGFRTVAFRVLTFPLRFTPLKSIFRPNDRARAVRRDAMAWYRAHGSRVTIVIPSYRDAARVRKLVKSIQRTTPRDRVRIVVADDASGSAHLTELSRIRGIEVIAGEENAGFAGNANRGLRAADPDADVVILNSDVVARRGWLATLQHAARHDERAGVIGGKLLYESGRIQSGGTVRNRHAPEWFDHRYRFKPADWGPAQVPQPVLAVTGACMYITRGLIDEIGLLDEAYPMAYEDVDFCLRAWQAGYRVLFAPAAELEHPESVTRGTEVGERERRAQRVFWERWGDLFDVRNARASTGALRVIYVTQDTGVGGGHRVVFEHLNHLRDRGHDVELWTLAGPPDWFGLRAPVRTFPDYPRLTEALAEIDAIKVATWWETAGPVWEASLLRGIPVYFVQDIETSYYRDSARARDEVLASYREEFRYVTTSSWNATELRALGHDAVLVPPGIDLDRFMRVSPAPRREDMVLAVGRSNPLKNFPLTLAAWRSLPEPRPELCLFGIEPELAAGITGVRYLTSPSDEEVNRLLNEATVFIQTSDHEGFCLPILEAMATGCPVVCTDAHGNRDFCADDINCLMSDADTPSLAGALTRLLDDPELRDRIGHAGLRTAATYGWPERIDALERFFEDIATPRRVALSDAVPQLRRTPAAG